MLLYVRKALRFKLIGLSVALFFITSLFGRDLGYLNQAQAAIPVFPGIPQASSLVPLSCKYVPVRLTGIKFYPDDPLKLDFIINKGDSLADSRQLKADSLRLINYFLTALTIPEDDLWVNLSPYESQRVITDSLGETDLGKDLLSQDYLLKQLSAGITYPESPLGKKFWDTVYAKAARLLGTNNLPFDTFNKIWIVPDKAKIYEDKDKAVIGESSLKVMMEADYLAMQKNVASVNSVESAIELKRFNGPNRLNKPNRLNELTAGVMREVILPLIEQDVNSGRNFSQLRQVCSAVILAAWFKRHFREAIEVGARGMGSSKDRPNRPNGLNGLNVFNLYFDQKKTKGIETNDPNIKEKIYRRYLEAYKKGAYNYIKKELGQVTKKPVRRRYFSGGMSMQFSPKLVSGPLDASAPLQNDAATVVSIELKAVDLTGNHSEERAKDDGQSGLESGAKKAEERRTRGIREETNAVQRKGQIPPVSFRSITLSRDRFMLTDAEIGEMFHYDLGAIKLTGWQNEVTSLGNAASPLDYDDYVDYVGGGMVTGLAVGVFAIGYEVYSSAVDNSKGVDFATIVSIALLLGGIPLGGILGAAVCRLRLLGWRLLFPISWHSHHNNIEKLINIGKRSIPVLLGKLNHKDSHVRRAVCMALGEIGDKSTEAAIYRAFSNTDPEVVYKAIVAINGRRRQFVENVYRELLAKGGDFSVLPEAIRFKEKGVDYEVKERKERGEVVGQEWVPKHTEWQEVGVDFGGWGGNQLEEVIVPGQYKDVYGEGIKKYLVKKDNNPGSSPLDYGKAGDGFTFEPQNPGGIDLKADKLNLQVENSEKGQGAGGKGQEIQTTNGERLATKEAASPVPLDLNPGNFAGFKVEILGMKEVENIKAALGVSPGNHLQEYSRLPQ